jgi:hypothetical protein
MTETLVLTLKGRVHTGDHGKMRHNDSDDAGHPGIAGAERQRREEGEEGL